MHKSIPYLIVFISGYVILGFETIGTKLFAPFLGTTVPVWAGLMAVIIAASSIGYYLGGRAWGRVRLPVLAGGAFALSALFVWTSAFWRSGLLAQLSDFAGYGFAAILASVCFFALPTCLLAFSTVVITRNAALGAASTGLVAGRLYAAATIGSVCGVFTLAYLLVPLFPLSQIMTGLSCAMALGALLSFLLLLAPSAARQKSSL